MNGLEDHTILPVEARRATTESAYRLAPLRSPP